jgi:membrane dipeptidase
MNRRIFLGKSVKGAAGAALLNFGPFLKGAPFFNSGNYRLFAGSEQTYSARAIELVQRTTVIDMLAPLWISPSRMMKMLGNP